MGVSLENSSVGSPAHPSSRGVPGTAPWASLLRGRMGPPVALLILVACVFAICFLLGESLEHEERIPPPTVLVDGIHQIDGLPGYEWTFGEHRYTHSASTQKLFQILGDNGISHGVINKGRLTPEVLAQSEVLFFNVPTSASFSRGREGMTGRLTRNLDAEEAEAIRGFVESGGGLLLVVEHNNAFDNVKVLQPLLKPWNIEVPAAYAHERVPGKYAINRSAYRILVRNFSEHFVTDGIGMISEAGGAPFAPKTDGGVAFLSKRGFIDVGDYTVKGAGKFSNNRVDKDEYQGADIPVAIAREVGKGRVVVLGDHTMLGAHWIGFGDNLDFALNIFQWLSGRDHEVPFREGERPWTVFGTEQDAQRWSVGAKKDMSHYGFYLALTQSKAIFSTGMVGYDRDVDVLGFLQPRRRVSPQGIEAARRTLRRGGKVFIMVDAENPSAGSIHLLEDLIPEVSFHWPGGHSSVNRLKKGDNPGIPRLRGNYLSLQSTELDVKGKTVAALEHDEKMYRRITFGERVPDKYDKGKPYLLDIQIEGGEPLAWATAKDGRRVTLLQRIESSNGEVILMPQAKVWNTETLPAFVVAPEKASRPAYEFLTRFVQWLEQQFPDP